MAYPSEFQFDANRDFDPDPNSNSNSNSKPNQDPLRDQEKELTNGPGEATSVKDAQLPEQPASPGQGPLPFAEKSVIAQLGEEERRLKDISVLAEFYLQLSGLKEYPKEVVLLVCRVSQGQIGLMECRLETGMSSNEITDWIRDYRFQMAVNLLSYHCANQLCLMSQLCGRVALETLVYQGLASSNECARNKAAGQLLNFAAQMARLPINSPFSLVPLKNQRGSHV